VDDTQQPSPDVLTQAQAAAYLGISVELLRKETLAGRVPAARLGRRWRYSRAALDELLRHRAEGDQ
jgi:excisionase family DNA binding protein